MDSLVDYAGQIAAVVAALLALSVTLRKLIAIWRDVGTEVPSELVVHDPPGVTREPEGPVLAPPDRRVA